MLIEDFNHTMDIWTTGLHQYNFSQLSAKSSPNSWSLGQVCMHLVADTRYYIEQIEICTKTNDHSDDEAAPRAKAMFVANDFPDEAIQGAPSNSYTPQPESKEHLMNGLTLLKDDMNRAARLISESTFKGKTKHPGLGYFSANEWLQFAEMHFRHHLRQKRRIEVFLNVS